jgi:hypothetical protein
LSFREAVEQDLGNAAWQPGLRALRAQDRTKIAPENTRKLKGSVDLDTQLLQQCPQANRWDFGIAYEHAGNVGEVVYWVETHTGSTREVKTVLKKYHWLRAWLNRHALGDLESEFVWVFSGANEILKHSPQARSLAEAELPTRARLEIRNEHRPLLKSPSA